MKLGFVSAILDQNNYEEMIDIAATFGYECVEVACWPVGKSERRYAGVTHIDVEKVLEDDAYASTVLEYAQSRNIEISSLAYYPNALDADEAKRTATIEHIEKLIKASAKLNINMVTTFIGRDQYKAVDENLEIMVDVWKPLLELAKAENVKVAIENCPMLFGKDQWPGGQNLMTTPDIWRKVFDLLPYDNFGLNYDPSHFVWQSIDYIKPIYEFKDKIFHVHYKDIKVFKDKLDRVGSMAYPLEYMSPKLPGLGDVDWGKYVSALTDIGYEGFTCIEVEDKAFEGTTEKVLDSLRISRLYMKQFVI
ncbi:sugar phosphate isomerase/epimerase family protein [Vibrio spartinae]|uniref:Inosose dehydratase n=1 Tax=Vibrio spartinae TaxID=1918945 RepID=A0A1N6MAT5_9VIBR|nr:sugar phosphate isomerase/epimerase [Vibrio spartinae]QMV13785.1 Inosose dehydratase [Vibrio spartinae]SIO96575.1 Inosose dehydratase [Vibrio spartinae]